jgi:serine/threonine-protein kinase
MKDRPEQPSPEPRAEAATKTEVAGPSFGAAEGAGARAEAAARAALDSTELAGPAEHTAPGTPPEGAARARETVGRFRIEAPLGSGGMADVFRAHDPALDRAVALKLLRAKRQDDDPQRMRRVLREARAAAALTHPNTVTIFDVGEADGEVFIAMELLEGEPLRRMIGRADLTLAQQLQWLLHAARALAAAHERGLVHRDVKPDNMFVCRDGTLKLLDFGIAKRSEDDSQGGLPPPSLGPSSMRTVEGRRIGTPRYMAPEQHAGQGTDARTDEYAWGLVACELLTGLHPVALLATVTMAGEPRAGEPGGGGAVGLEGAAALAGALRARVPALPEGVAEAVTRALAIQKEDRFPSMAPIVAALEKAGSASDVEPSARLGGARPATRGWRVALVAVAVLAVVVAGVFGARSLLRARGVGAGVGTGVGAGADKRATAKALAPACVVEPARTLSLAADDRAGVLPDGQLVTMRDIKRGLSLMRETASAPVPFSSYKLAPTALAAAGNDYRNAYVLGARADGKSWGVVLVTQRPDKPDVLVFGATAAGDFFLSAPPLYRVSGLIVAPSGKDLVFGVTTTEGSAPRSGALVGFPKRGARAVEIEHGVAYSPALASSASRMAFAYVFLEEKGPTLHLAILDEDAHRLGDVHAITSTPTLPTPPAVAFAGDAAAVLWIDDRGGKSRLTMATFAQGASAVSAPRVAVDEPVTLTAPVTAQLPTGEWVVAWLASTGGAPTLRVSPIGKNGELTGPTDVATRPTFEVLRATSGDRGVELSWQERERDGTTTARFAHVTCAPR